MKTFINLFLSFLCSLHFLAADEPLETRETDEAFCYAAKPVVDLYKDASTKSHVIANAVYGMSLEILDNTYIKWTKVKANDFTGWAQNRDLSYSNALYPNAADPNTPVTATIQVPQATVSFIRKPGHRVKPPLQFPYGVSFEVTNVFKNEVEIKLLDGTFGYIAKKDVVFEKKPLSFQEMLNLAKKCADIPVGYVKGGTSTFGFDSGGFIQFLFRQMGKELPREPRDIVNLFNMQPILQKNLQVGDFIFLGDSEDKITHVGLYLGEDKFIYAGHIDRNYWSKKTGPSFVCIPSLRSSTLQELYPTILFGRLIEE